MRMPENEPSLEELAGWTEKMLTRLRRMLDPTDPIGNERTFDELTEMSERFLALARSFVECSRIANDAAQSMLPGARTDTEDSRTKRPETSPSPRRPAARRKNKRGRPRSK
jgi:hypothetical protein